MNEKQKWFSTGYLRGSPTGSIDSARGIVEGVSVCSAGEAKGHGVHLDHEFIETVVQQGASLKQGLKARFGHPTMCSTALGTFIGRFKNFRMVGDQAKADLFLSNEAKDTPHGNLYDYVLGMARNEPDMFGTSIVFTPGETYVYNDEGNKDYTYDSNTDKLVYVDCEKLHACDAVDEPAANDGLFSAFSQEHMAGQITEFLDLHPQVFDALQTNPNVIEALGNYGDKIDEFINRYTEYRVSTTDKEENTMSDEIRSDEQEEIVELESAEETTTEVEETEAPENESDETPESVEETETAEPGTESEEEPEALEESNDIDREEFARAVEDFGAVTASKAFCAGGGYAEAQTAHYEALETELAELKSNQAVGAIPIDLGTTDNETKTKRNILRNI